MKTTNLLSRSLRPAVRALAALACPAALAANVALPAAPTSLSSAIQSKIALWLRGDANLVADASGNVVAWCDAREDAVADEAAYEARVAAGSWTYPRAVVYKDGAAPSGDVPVGADPPASFGGKPYVDFGEYHDNRWMLFVDAAGARKRVSLVGYAGYFGFGSTAGFVVGDVDKPDIIAYSVTNGATIGANGRVFFHKGAGGSGDDVIFSASTGNNYGTYGETRLNGHVVNPTSAKHVRNGWETFVQNGPNASGLFVSTLFNNGNAKTGYMENLSTDPTSRQGGGRIAEIMLFAEMLTQEEVAEVEAYLRARWQGGSGSATATLALASGDTLTVSAAAPAFVGDIAGAGAIEKTGTSSLTIDRGGRLAAGALTLREGGVVTWAKRAHHAPLVAIGGKTVAAAASTLSTRDDDANPDTFTVAETVAGRKVSLAGAEDGVKTVVAEKAALGLAPPALPPAAVATAEDPDFLAIGNLIKNGSFEDDKITGNSGKWQSNASGWTIAKQSTVNSTVGIERWGSNTWANNNVVNTTKYQENVIPDTAFPDGTQCAFIQVASPSTNSLNQTVSVAKPGLYRLSAWIRCRLRKAEYTDHSAIAWFAVDGTDVVARRTGFSTATERTGYSSFSCTNSTPFNFRKVAVDIPLSAGEHVISVKASAPYGANASQDRALCVDDVRLVPVADGDFILVPDANFETMANQPGISENTGIYRATSNGFDVSFWTFSNCGITRYPSSWFWNSTYDDNGEDQVLYLGNTSGAASASQTISFPSDGRVRVSFRYANRTKNLSSGAARPSGQTLAASLGGTQFFSAVVTNENFTTACAECAVSAGSQTLLFSNSANTTILDDVRIEYVGGTDRAVEDAAFTDGSSTWTRSGAVAESDAFGLRELVFTGTASATASFSVPADGYYLLTFQSRGRPLSERGTSGVYHSFNYYTHNLDVRVDGGFIANVYNAHVGRFPVEMRLPYLTAGTHTLLFAGSSDSSVATTAQSRISDVTVTPLATGAMADWSGVEFELDSDAKINADLPGKVRLGKLKVAGVTKYGEFTAANCDFVTGTGTVEIIPEAFVLVVR